MQVHSPNFQPPRQQRVIGLTGGVGMGKTTISGYLTDAYQIPVLDADVYAREAVEANSPILTEITERYGLGVLLPNGQLDRRRLGDIVFSSSSERLWVEQRIHPYVRDRFNTELQQLPFPQVPMVVLVVPLLFEARMLDLVTEVWVVHCPRSQQIERIQQREPHLTLEQIQARIDSQSDIQKKIACADVVLDNATTTTDLLQQIDQVLGRGHKPPFPATPPIEYLEC